MQYDSEKTMHLDFADFIIKHKILQTSFRNLGDQTSYNSLRLKYVAYMFC